ncbi:MAG: hypothetical protein RLZZ517_2 [Candidatus Parcubacteria bacterium]
MGLLLGLILPDKEKDQLEKDRTRLTTSCINYQQKIEVLIGALQSEEVQIFEYLESPPPNVEIKDFIGIMFWTTGLDLEGKPEILPDSEVHIVENKMPQLFQTPTGAKGFLLKGTFFGD